MLAVEALPEDERMEGEEERLLKEIQAEAYWGLPRTAEAAVPWDQEREEGGGWEVEREEEEEKGGYTWEEEEEEGLDLRQTETEPQEPFHISMV